MDGTVVDFQSGINELTEIERKQYEGNEDDHPEIFSKMQPVSGAIDTISKLNTKYDLYLLSTAPWDNPNAWKHKREWIERYFGKGTENIFYKKVILSHHKNLNIGDILIDDRPNNGAKEFHGEWILFGSNEFPSWELVVKKLISK